MSYLLSYPSLAARRLAAALFSSALLWCALPLLFLLGPAVAVHAATRVVTSTADSGTGSLRAVIAAAGAGDTLTFSVPAHSTIRLTTGALAIGKSLSITGPSGGVAIDGGGRSGIFSVTGGTASSPVVLTGLTLQNGNASAGYGGGVYNVGTTKLTGCTLTSNSSENYQGGHGGGVYNNGTVTLTNCTLTGNTAPDIGGAGGGVYNDNSSTATLTGCILTSNGASENGGGVYNLSKASLTGCTLTSNGGSGVYTYGGTVSLADCTLAKNSTGVTNNRGTVTLTGCTLTGHGNGGIFSNATAMLTGCTLTNNSAQNGGAVEAIGGTATLTDCVLSNNSASQSGGGVYNNGTVTLTGCTLTGNTAPEGGGICNNRATLSMTDCTLVQNSALLGGAVYNNDSYLNTGSLSMTDCTLTQNSAIHGSFPDGSTTGLGGGIYNNEGTVTLTNDILYGDGAAESNPEIYAAGALYAYYCDIGQAADYEGDASDLDADPAFVRTPGTNSAADLGDLHLKPGSPCFGKGAPSQAGTEDKDGVTRANPPTIGAYEGAKASTQTQIALAAGSSATLPVGGSASFTVTVANATSPGGPTPTGTVLLRVNGSPVGSPVALEGGSVTLAHTFALVGSYPISAAYTPDATNSTASVSGNLTETVVGKPTANAQSVSVAFNTAKAITLTGSDPNTPARSLTYTVATGPTHGTLSGLNAATGAVTYTPTGGYHGADSFTFQVSNGASTSSTAAVSLTVAAGVPTANPQAASVAFNTAKAITLTGSDPDVPVLILTYAVAVAPTHGTLAGTAPNLTYTPTAGYHGADSFTFTARNGTNTSSAATVTLTIAAGVPTASAQNVMLAQDSPVAITLAGSDPDVPTLGLTYAITTGPAHGKLSGTAPSLTYTPTAGYTGPDAFIFAISNGVNTSPPATVSLSITPVVATDVTSQVTITPGDLRHRSGTTFAQFLTLTNNTQAPIPGPLTLALDFLSRNARLLNATGATAATSPAGSPTVVVSADGLAVGQSILVNLSFSDANYQHINFAPRVLSGNGD